MRPVIFGAMLACAAACEREPSFEPPPRPTEPAGPKASDEPEIPKELRQLIGDASVGGADASAAAGAVAELRRTQLELAPRHTAAERLAFGKGRFAQLTTDALVVRDTTGFGEVVRLQLEGPRRVVELADGGLLGIGASGAVRLERGKKDPLTLGRIPLFPDSLVFGDRRDEARVWVLHSFGSLLYQYSFGGDAGAGGVETLDFLDLEGFDQRAFAALKDGSFLYTAGDKLRRFFHGGKRWDLALPEGGKVWRLLTTRRIDQVWIAREGGALDLAQISATGVRVVRSVRIEHAFDVATNDKEIAAVRVQSEPGKPRRWSLAVHEPSGKLRFEAELPPEPPAGAGDSWVQAVTRDKTLALSSYAPLAAVGGPGWVAVWNTKTGKRVLSP
jgi:hypothetical protein